MLLLDRQGLYILLAVRPQGNRCMVNETNAYYFQNRVYSLFYSTLLHRIQFALLRYCQNSDPIHFFFPLQVAESNNPLPPSMRVPQTFLHSLNRDEVPLQMVWALISCLRSSLTWDLPWGPFLVWPWLHILSLQTVWSKQPSRLK